VISWFQKIIAAFKLSSQRYNVARSQSQSLGGGGGGVGGCYYHEVRLYKSGYSLPAACKRPVSTTPSLNLKCDLLVSEFAFKWVNLYRYHPFGEVDAETRAAALAAAEVWGCTRAMCQGAGPSRSRTQ
jgi:hypothetical protein